MKGFLACNHPVKVNTLKGLQLVACGKCIQCKTARRRKTELLLSLETQNHRYCELINLTYNDEFLPWVDLSAVDGKFNGVSPELDYFMRIAHPIHFGDRKKRMYNPRTRQYYDVVDTYYLKPHYTTAFGEAERWNNFDTFDYSSFIIKLQNYNKRVDEYYIKYPWRKRGFSRQKHHVAILWQEDLQRYLDRLKKFILRTYGTKVRYFAVGEYGTNSLRPHWHIVLFHDSPRLRDAFTDVYRYPNSTEQNPRECANTLRNAALWTYGDCTTTPTDGHASSYLSGYLNQSASLPRLLDAFPQKTFKSIYLGEGRDMQQISALLKNRDFERLTTTTLKSRQGVERRVSVPSTSYNRFHIGFTCDGVQDVASTYTLLNATKWLLNRTDINIYDDQDIYNVLLWLNGDRWHFTDVEYWILQPLIRYVRDIAIPIFRSTQSLNPLKSVFYATKKLYKMSHLLDIQPWYYLRLVDDFEKWLDYQNLIHHLKMLEDNPTLSYQYYITFDPVNGIPDFNKYRSTSYFMQQQTMANMDWYSSIKHKDVVMQYKTDL